MKSCIALVALLHVSIKVVSAYCDFKYKLGHNLSPQSTSTQNNESSTKAVYTLSLGAALYFALILISGLLVRSETRHRMLYFYKPLQITAVAVLFPLFIILWNRKLKHEFVELFQRPKIKTPFCCVSNRIYSTLP